MAPGYPGTAGWCWNNLPSRIMSSSGLSGKPLLLFVEQCDFFLPYCKLLAYRPLAIACKNNITVSFRYSYLDLLLFFILFKTVSFAEESFPLLHSAGLLTSILLKAV